MNGTAKEQLSIIRRILERGKEYNEYDGDNTNLDLFIHALDEFERLEVYLKYGWQHG